MKPIYSYQNINFYCCDCMDFMRDVPDKYYDLVIADPPYGIGKDWMKDSRGRRARRYIAFNKTYKNERPITREQVKEILRISKNQIFWGWNYYAELLPSTNFIIVWNKLRSVEKTFRSECELAWTSFKIPMRIFEHRWDGCKKATETGILIIHPHQKPINLYRWCLQKYAKPGDKICDTHGGSFSSAIACHMEGFAFDGCELDPEYLDLAIQRFKDCSKQISMKFLKKGS